MNKLKLTSPIPPSVNHYLGWRAVMKGKVPIVMSYQTLDSQKYKKEFGKYVEQEVKKQNWKKIDNKFQHYYVDCIFYFDRIDKDCNNYFKCLLDCITDTKLIWDDDNVVCERVNKIFYDSKNSRIELEIYPVDYIGIFNNHAELENFTSNCSNCIKYKNRKCNILNKAIEGRIQEEISNNICTKFKSKEG